MHTQTSHPSCCSHTSPTRIQDTKLAQHTLGEVGSPHQAQESGLTVRCRVTVCSTAPSKEDDEETWEDGGAHGASSPSPHHATSTPLLGKRHVSCFWGSQSLSGRWERSSWPGAKPSAPEIMCWLGESPGPPGCAGISPGETHQCCHQCALTHSGGHLSSCTHTSRHPRL